MTPPAKKKSKTEEEPMSSEEKLINQVWEHYRNFLDSCQQEDGDEDGDIDELQEIVILLKEGKTAATLGTTREELLPIVASLAHLQLANVVIAQTVDSYSEDGESTSAAVDTAAIQHHLKESLRYFPCNCAAWSVGANYARMGQLVPPSLIAKWYLKAATHASNLRTQALDFLEGDNAVEDVAVKEWLELLILVGMVDTEFVDGDDEGDEEEEEEAEKEKEDDEEEEGYYSTSAVEATSRFMRAMLLSTLGKHDDSLTELQHFDLTHRLHPNVWLPQPSNNDEDDDTNGPTAFNGSVLPKELYNQMCDAFAPDAVYWKESDYAHRGYYSYFFDIPTKPSNLIEEVIVNHLLPLAKKCQKGGDDEIVGAEWWVHHRPIQANLGHNLHFDTDEALLSQEGVISHPVLSSVLYLTAGEEATSGPTIVLDQPPDATKNASKCWKCVPKNNTFMVFDGSLLHGVLPCPGQQEYNTNDNSAVDGNTDSLIWPAKEKAEAPSHRLTFMIGFWTRRVPDKMKNRVLYGPCGPLPPTDSSEWVQQISRDFPRKTEPSKTITKSALPTISPAWEVMQLNKGDPLDIPRALDHRFFVNGAPKCFRDSLFEEGEEGEEEF